MVDGRRHAPVFEEGVFAGEEMYGDTVEAVVIGGRDEAIALVEGLVFAVSRREAEVSY